MAWGIAEKGKGIVTPTGTYAPKTDNLESEIKAAAKSAGLENFNVKIGGEYFDNPEDLDTNSIADLGGAEVVVEPYDIAG